MSIFLNIACLGAGNHAFKNTLPILSNLKNFKLVGIYKRNFKNDFKKYKKFNCEVSDDLNKVLNKKNLDAVYISSQPSMHYILAKKALLLNKHVILEKPAVTNLNQAKKLSLLASQKKLVIMEGFMFKYHKQFTEIFKILKSNKEKKLLEIRATFGFPHLHKSNFRYNKKAGGGSLLDAGAYTISFIRTVSQNKLKLTKTKLLKKNYNVDTTGFAEFECRDKCKYKAKWYFGNKYKNEIIFKYSDLKIIVNRAFSKPKNLVTDIEFYKKKKLVEVRKIKKDNHFKNMFNHFYNCCFKEDLRIYENFELLNQAKTINKIILKNNH